MSVNRFDSLSILANHKKVADKIGLEDIENDFMSPESCTLGNSE